MKLLIIEDNPRLIERMIYQLRKWFVVEAVSSGDEGLVAVNTGSFDAILLDLGLPDMPGLEVCRRLREISKDIPILVVTGVDSIPSKVELLDAGADDYITKPFDAQELRARINALIRRRPRLPSIALITAGDLSIDPARRVVHRANILVKLRRKEFDILEYLAINQGRVLTREMIVNHAWSSTTQGWTGSVDVHIKHIRDKIDKPFNYPLIKTIYAVGYMLDTSRKNRETQVA